MTGLFLPRGEGLNARDTALEKIKSIRFTRCISRVALLLTVLGSVIVASAGTDTLRIYNLRNGVAAYDTSRTLAYAARFTSLVNVKVFGLRIIIRGDSAAQARVRVFGAEGGGSVPSIEQDLVEPVLVRADNARMDTLAVTYDPPLSIIEGQFFVCVDSVSRMGLLTDRDSVVPECICHTDRFVNQCMKSVTGEWKTGPFTFLIEPILSVDESVAPLQFESDTFQLSSTNSKEEFSILVADFDNNGSLDVVAGGSFLRGPFKSGTRSTESCVVDAIHKSMSGTTLLSTLRVNAAAPSIVGIKCGNRLEYQTWYSGTVEGITVTLPMQGKPVFSIALQSIPSAPEVLVVAERSSENSSSSLGDTETTSANDQLHVISGIGSVVQEDVVQIPTGLFVQSGFSTDIDRDGDLDLLIACTNNDGRMIILKIVNIQGVFSVLQEVERLSLPLNARPVLSLTPRRSQIQHEEKIDDESVIVSTAVGGLNISGAIPKSFSRVVIERDDEIEQRGISYHDRLSSVSHADINGDGIEEFVVSSEDTCRKTALYMTDDTGTYQRIYGSGIEAISGSPDVAWVDLDGDNDVDAVALVGSSLIIGWNRSPQLAANSRLYPIDPELVNSVSVAEFNTSSSTYSMRASWGGGRNIHVRSSPAVLIEENEDTIIVIRRFTGGHESINKFTARTSALSDADAAACRIHLTPNPFFSEVNISVDVKDGPIETCSIVNSAGEIVWSALLSASSSTCIWDGKTTDGSPIANGTYTIHVKTHSCSATSRAMKVQ